MRWTRPVLAFVMVVGLSLAVPAVAHAQPARPTTTPKVHTFPRFRYPVVMAFPLVLLVVGGYLAWALTEPLDRR